MMQTHNEDNRSQNVMRLKSSIPQKRAAPDEETDARENHSSKTSSSSKIPKGEYETGRVMCEVCGKGISFRDDTSGNFTLKHWDAHRQECISPPQPPTEPVIYTPESTAQALISPPAKRRRAKRTEEERIEYLRADPYVARFEAYRVLCASCDKWIRLRPNSTYCSIPWDAHRKSCLSKKLTNPNMSALEERNSILSKDPDVRKFDAERVLCDICDKWLGVNPENHTAALQKWVNHRTSCQNTLKYATNSPDQPPTHRRVEVPPLSEQQLALAPLPAISRTPVSTPGCPLTSPSPVADATRIASYFKGELNPNNFPSSHESRQKSAEQRAAALRSDPLLEEVEPNRVFCTLCKKWVQLRQDSSYCAYPWLQHRGKCSMRRGRISQRTTELAEHRAQDTGLQERDQSLDEDEDDWVGDEPDPQQDLPDHMKGPRLRPTVQAQRDGSRPGSSRKGQVSTDRELTVKQSTPLRHLARRLSINFADLDSLSGRISFIFASIAYLFTTTYDALDDLTISSLLSYLNAAIPPDKHEDFDTAEVVKAAASLQNRGDIIFEGDILRLPD